MRTRLRVAVVSGGASPEHGVSLVTGRALAVAARALGHTVVRIRVSREGVWSRLPIPRKRRRHTFASLLRPQRTAAVDVVLNGFHGAYGEDGRVQGLLDLLGVPYTGSGVFASSLAMDKTRFKHFLRSFGIASPGGITVLRRNGLAPALRQVRGLSLPLFVKPNSQGSSVATTLCTTRTIIAKAIRSAWRLDAAALIEPDLGRDEYTVPTIGKQAISALPVIAIRPTRAAFFSYEVKYDGSTQELCPAPISGALRRRLQAIAVQVHRELGARGVIRTDFIVVRQRPYVLETNTLPGLTPESLVPKSAAAFGWTFPQLVQRLIDLAT